MTAPTWLMLIAAATFGYAIRVASESVRWHPPMPVAPVRRGAYALWLAPPLLVLMAIIGWAIHLR